MAELLENLNERQREAVLETEGYVRVIAGAGSGKTKLLVNRYAYLVQDYGIDASNILCVTFTNKAAGEMKRRICGLIGDDNDVSLICTYHGFCNRLLRENPEKLFLNKQFQIMDNHQQKTVLGEIYQRMELKLDYATFEAMLRKIGYVKRNLKYVARLCNPRPCQIMEEIRNQDDRIIESFLQRQKATYSLDFHDLIACALYLLETDEEIREKWQERLNYIMVDEFQDSSAVEMRLVEILSRRYRNLMIVGDPDQNIYEWRGSDVRLLVEFDKAHEGTKTIILNQNYRSTPQILQCANTLIEKNELRLKKDLFTRNAAGKPVVHFHSKDDFAEMDRVADTILDLHKREGLRYSDFAILYRSGFLSRVAEKKLAERKIPYEIFGGVRFYQRMEILDILAYLKLIAYDDDDAFKRVVNTPRRRFGRAKMNLLETKRERARSREELTGRWDWDQNTDSENRFTLFRTLSENLDDPEFSGSDVGDFVRFVESMHKRCAELRIPDIVNEVTEKTGYESYIRELGDEERLDNLAEFKRIANEFEGEFGENLSLTEFLRQIALQSGEEDGGESRDTVKLMTIHSSKGLEFPAVFILGFTEGIFPSAKTLGERKKLGLEEERRLCYVAITRAERYLFLMDSEGTSDNGMKKLYSRFLEEIGEENYTRIGRISEELRRERSRYTARLNGELREEPAVDKKPGDAVEHHIFGKGVIQSIDAKRGSYCVKFEKLQHPRNISAGYFAREHADIRGKGDAAQASQGPEAVKREETDSGARVSEKTFPGRMNEGEQRRETERQEETEHLEAEERREGAERQETADRREEIEETEHWKAAVQEGAEGREAADRPEGKVGQGEAARREEYLRRGLSEKEERKDCPTEPGGAKAKIIAGDLPVMRNRPAEPDEAEEPQPDKAQRPQKSSLNLWKQEDVPRSGWSCVGVEDLGAPAGICQMCGYQIIRYVHHMEHPAYKPLSVGCVCAGKMEGDIGAAKRREAEFKKRQARQERFLRRDWMVSKKGNEYLKIDGHVVVLYRFEAEKLCWKYSVDNVFGKTAYAAREAAIAGAFDALEEMKK